MEVKKFNKISELAAYRKDDNSFENGEYIAVVDVLGKIEQAAAFVQKHSWREAVDEFFGSLTDEFYAAKLHDHILESCENGVFNKRDTSNAPYGLDWSVEPYDYCGGGCFVFVQAPKTISSKAIA
jgi:hypothetical protein|nr:MAG TPA: hypothetical protein [Caudoviricetes sp.]